MLMRSAKLTAAALVIQAASYWFAVMALPISNVGTETWFVLYAGCAAVLAIGSLVPTLRLEFLGWLQVLVYSILLSAIFFGADFALEALRGAVRPRTRLPASFHGLEFYLVLAPGLASSAVGGAVGNLLARWTQRFASRRDDPSSSCPLAAAHTGRASHLARRRPCP
jgi:hypothetical protein